MNHLSAAPHGGASRALLALALAGSFSFAAAAEPPDSLPEVELAPITVSASGGAAVPYDRAGVSVTVLNIPELKKEGIDTVNEALATVPGVAVQPGGLNQRGNVSNIAIRGMNRAQYTLPMVDGMRLYSFSDANVTPNIVGRADLFSLGTLELLRGAQGAVYGAGAMGGVIFMETPEGQGEPSFKLFNEVGSFDSYTGNATAQGREGQLGYFLSTTYERTNNDMAYADGRPLPAKHAGHYEGWNEALRLDADLNPDNKLSFTWRREDADYRCLRPVYPGFEAEAYDYSFRSNLVTAKWQLRVDEAYSTSLMAGYYGMDNMLGRGENIDLRNLQLEWRNIYRWCEHHSTTAGMSWNRSQYDYRSNWPDSDRFDTLDNCYGFFAEHLYRPAPNWDHSLALRWDQSSIWDGLATFRAASNYRFNDESSRLFASVGSGYKTPAALQRGGLYHSAYGTTSVGNPGLNCEQNLSVDVGLEQQMADEHTVTATLFWLRVEDGIAEQKTNLPNCTTWVNKSGHWTSQGIELAAQGTWEQSWKTGYRVAFTYTQPKDERGRQLFQTSRQQWSADVHTSPFAGFTTGLGLTASVGRTGASAIRLDNYCCLRWYARYELNEQWSFHLRVENLTGERFMAEEVWGAAAQGGALLSSGAAVYGGCTLSF